MYGGMGLIDPSTKADALMIRSFLRYHIKNNLTWLNLEKIENPPNSNTQFISIPHVKRFLSVAPYIPKNLLNERTTTKEIYDHLVREKQKSPKVVLENQNNRNWKNVWRNINLRLLDSYEKSLIYKLIHNGFISKTYLQKIGLASSNLCDKCSKVDYGLLHKLECDETSKQMSNFIISSACTLTNIPLVKEQLWKLDFNFGRKHDQLLIKIIAYSIKYLYWSNELNFPDFKDYFLNEIKNLIISNDSMNIFVNNINLL